MNRLEIADLILTKLSNKTNELKQSFASSSDDIGFFYIDNLLPENLALEISNKFPKPEETQLKKSLKEFKHVAYQMNEYDSLLEEVIYAFQDKRIVKVISEICSIKNVYPDENLYAGGLSLMTQNNFLNPHLDNSHDRDRKCWRVLNLLYYISPDWKIENGGNLELWPNGLKEDPVTIISKFNRLVVMATHQESWHSVNQVLVDKPRQCVSNYYFSDEPLRKSDQFHVTTFRGRSNEKIKNLIFKIDAKLRMTAIKFLKEKVSVNKHFYKK